MIMMLALPYLGSSAMASLQEHMSTSSETTRCAALHTGMSVVCVPHVYRTCIMVYGLQAIKVQRYGITAELLSAQACTFLLALQAQPIHTSAHTLHTYLRVRAISAALFPMMCTARPQQRPTLPHTYLQARAASAALPSILRSHAARLAK